MSFAEVHVRDTGAGERLALGVGADSGSFVCTLTKTEDMDPLAVAYQGGFRAWLAFDQG